MPDNKENKYVVEYFLGVNLMLGVERQSHANRDQRIIVDHDMIQFWIRKNKRLKQPRRAIVQGYNKKCRHIIVRGELRHFALKIKNEN
jgi:hypothetical protein